jgi:hypothetical protein
MKYAQIPKKAKKQEAEETLTFRRRVDTLCKGFLGTAAF